MSDERWIFGNDGSQLTPFHLIVLFLACASLLAAQLDIPPPISDAVQMWQRGMVLLVGATVLRHIVASSLAGYKAEAERKLARQKSKIDVTLKGKIESAKDPWSHVSAHPSAFLTTKDGKPRLFPFPLGKAGAETKELWWEAGNSAHVGHFNQRETPEAKEALRIEWEEKEAARQARAKSELKKMDSEKAKSVKMADEKHFSWLIGRWLKRLSNVKLICGVVVVGLVHRPTAVLCLAALIYYILASELAGMLDLKEAPGDEVSGVRRKKLPDTPGMGLTYLYEPNGDGGLQVQGAIPVNAPTHKLMTSTSSRYAT